MTVWTWIVPWSHLSYGKAQDCFIDLCIW
jgi:hypothetical protein